MDTKLTTTWENYADEHILDLRANDPVNPTAYEFIRARSNHDGRTIEWLHGVVFIDDYLATHAKDPARLDSLLAGFGYYNLDDFVCQCNPNTEALAKRIAIGDIDRANDPDYIIDLPLLASLIAESWCDSEFLPAETAKFEYRRITGKDCDQFIDYLASQT